jgi:membrane protein YdbS with pleckstrin-like domain
MAQSTSTEQKKPEGMGWRVAASIVTFFGFVIAVILWLFFYAMNFNVYQNIAIVVVMILAFVAVMGATWASWGMKQGLGQRSKEENM